ncbi:hypothetical protein JKP88DRAFT_290763 [Tribonema minus]|uniref:Peptidase C19 ubiquitin carboxyl-terminal hydrolase domain-containing protein n=1 Tax=Tribonema minus TaxID=303371 RepID=A0A836CDJ4_9STRA|nr:hypothetical protein JKP88DRAFT_290763 [Tribonema minus]
MAASYIYTHLLLRLIETKERWASSECARLPRVIVLLLMRQNAAVSGAEEGWQAAKMTHHVSPNTRLTMPDGTLYTLKAVVHHTGDAVDRGHNLTIAHTAEGWCKFDGDVVERSSTPETQQPVGAHVTAAVDFDTLDLILWTEGACPQDPGP